jgi:hypothetical protein
MSFVSDMLTKITDLIHNIGKKGVAFAGRRLHKLPVPLPKGKLLFIGPGAFLCVLIICLVAAAVSMNRSTDSLARETGALGGAFQPQIPPEELFFFEEPDFLPGVIPERERRDSWTAEDAEPFWYNPLEKGEDQWRDRVESVIDELLEHVP